MEQNIPLFISIWVGLGILEMIFYTVNRNASLKRKLHPWINISGNLIFFLFILSNRPPQQVILMFAVFLAFTTFINIKNTKFCSACGKTVFGKGIFSTQKHCPNCGHDLNNLNKEEENHSF